MRTCSSLDIEMLDTCECPRTEACNCVMLGPASLLHLIHVIQKVSVSYGNVKYALDEP